MRSVTYPNFCSPCLESLWLNLLARVDLIDNLDVSFSKSPQTNPSSSISIMKAALRLVPFGHLRGSHYEAQTLALPGLFEPLYVPPPDGEYYSITWYRGDKHLQEFEDKLEAEIDDWDETKDAGRWRVDVKLSTQDVRKDPMSRLLSHRAF